MADLAEPIVNNSSNNDVSKEETEANNNNGKVAAAAAGKGRGRAKKGAGDADGDKPDSKSNSNSSNDVARKKGKIDAAPVRTSQRKASLAASNALKEQAQGGKRDAEDDGEPKSKRSRGRPKQAAAAAVVAASKRAAKSKGKAAKAGKGAKGAAGKKKAVENESEEGEGITEAEESHDE